MPLQVKTQHYDPTRTGANLQETTLTAGNVKPGSFGKVMERFVWGSVYAQPLYLEGVDIPGKGRRNVLYVATMHNCVYALDADHLFGPAHWGPVSLGTPIALPDPGIGWGANYRDIATEVGILSTPVLSTVYNAIYLVAATKDGGTYAHHLHALDLATGKQKLGAPQLIAATVSGHPTAEGEQGQDHVTFTSNRQVQRSALLKLGDRIYATFAAYGDQPPYHGWVFAFDARTLQQQAVFCTTPDGSGSGIWMAGQGPAGDGEQVYVITGNGSTSRGHDYSCAILELDAATLAVRGWFAPSNRGSLNGEDVDLGSAGPLLLPGTGVVVGGGKEGRAYVLKRGSFPNAEGDGGAQQALWAAAPVGTGRPTPMTYGGKWCHHIHGAPVFWDGPKGPHLFVGPEADNIRSFFWDGNQLHAAQTSAYTTPDNSMPGAILSLSANGNGAGSGVLWASVPIRENANQAVVAGHALAFDPTDLSRVLWDSEADADRDRVGAHPKFCPPMVANGRMYLPAFCGLYSKRTFGEFAIEGPSLADTYLGHLLVAWTGNDRDHSLNVARTDDLATLYGKVTLPEHSNHAPSVAFGDRTYLAWTGTDKDCLLNVARSTDFTHFDKVTLTDRSAFGPSIAFAFGRLWIAWTGVDEERHVNVMVSDDGVHFHDKQILGERSIAAPTLVWGNDHLWLLWTGNDPDRRLNVMQSRDGTTWTDKVTLTESSQHAPTMTCLLGSNLLLWSGMDKRVNLRSTDPGATGYHGKQVYPDTTDAAVATSGFFGRPVMGWTGTDGRLNLAPYGPGQINAYGEQG